ncbi:hypothetical protein SPRG_11261 [Saprolegnia parasitica CBS 223.65]|uniref:Uncharacterized protein n=2 Tax=Saprolegnia parasitica (strain CBS 223.65) TaxID=695850 RepID=A0A067BZ84_SAPPC|nr:hypothetical protein SPRG_11261 [Saprolegnia parasitica CBS 223.65]KDO23829.1 hypothetical protein SPRG_11261 [Saprolegnia parasitica CBS 223.65]|eukprot:XP_012205462.1 hypothetical protein SPRG_11261 [Saprolegnia parasitica CBS 223.65]
MPKKVLTPEEAEARRLRRNEQCKQYHIKNRERRLAYKRENHAKNKAHRLQKMKEWREKNKERRNVYFKEWWRKNRAKTYVPSGTDSDDSSSSTNLLMLSEVALQVKVESPLSSDDDLHSKAKTKLACYLKNETLYCPFV